MSEVPNIPEAVEVDQGEEETDSTYGDEIQSYTTSLSSSIRNHSFENGRRYHAYKDGTYFMPNDESESDRMDMMHHLFTLIIDGELHVAPIGKNPQRVLDLGTGTGIVRRPRGDPWVEKLMGLVMDTLPRWAIEMADMYPSAEVIGVDLSPIQPNMVPVNARFEVDDIESEWTYSAPFDLIHSRFLAGSIQDWQRLVAQTYKHTKPGGWCEFKDLDITLSTPDNSIPEDSEVFRFHELLIDACRNIGRDPDPGSQLKKWLEDAGFVDVKEVIQFIPIGLWPKDKKQKEIGAWNYTCLVEGLEAASLRLLTAVHGWSVAEVQLFLARVRNQLRDKTLHTMYTHYAITGRKPEDPS